MRHTTSSPDVCRRDIKFLPLLFNIRSSNIISIFAVSPTDLTYQWFWKTPTNNLISYGKTPLLLHQLLRIVEDFHNSLKATGNAEIFKLLLHSIFHLEKWIWIFNSIYYLLSKDLHFHYILFWSEAMSSLAFPWYLLRLMELLRARLRPSLANRMSSTVQVI